MTPEDAIIAIKLLKPDIEWDLSLEYQEALDEAIKALEKQIPKPVRITTSTKRCGRCGRQLSGIGNLHPERNYCTKCGQAIYWR